MNYKYFFNAFFIIVLLSTRITYASIYIPHNTAVLEGESGSEICFAAILKLNRVVTAASCPLFSTRQKITLRTSVQPEAIGLCGSGENYNMECSEYAITFPTAYFPNPNQPVIMGIVERNKITKQYPYQVISQVHYDGEDQYTFKRSHFETNIFTQNKLVLFTDTVEKTNSHYKIHPMKALESRSTRRSEQPNQAANWHIVFHEAIPEEQAIVLGAPVYSMYWQSEVERPSPPKLEGIITNYPVPNNPDEMIVTDLQFTPELGKQLTEGNLPTDHTATHLAQKEKQFKTVLCGSGSYLWPQLNKFDAVYEQSRVKKARATHLTFHDGGEYSTTGIWQAPDDTSVVFDTQFISAAIYLSVVGLGIESSSLNVASKLTPPREVICPNDGAAAAAAAGVGTDNARRSPQANWGNTLQQHYQPLVNAIIARRGPRDIFHTRDEISTYLRDNVTAENTRNLVMDPERLRDFILNTIDHSNGNQVARRWLHIDNGVVFSRLLRAETITRDDIERLIYNFYLRQALEFFGTIVRSPRVLLPDSGLERESYPSYFRIYGAAQNEFNPRNGEAALDYVVRVIPLFANLMLDLFFDRYGDAEREPLLDALRKIVTTHLLDESAIQTRDISVEIASYFQRDPRSDEVETWLQEYLLEIDRYDANIPDSNSRQPHTVVNINLPIRPVANGDEFTVGAGIRINDIFIPRRDGRGRHSLESLDSPANRRAQLARHLVGHIFNGRRIEDFTALIGNQPNIETPPNDPNHGVDLPREPIDLTVYARTKDYMGLYKALIKRT